MAPRALSFLIFVSLFLFSFSESMSIESIDSIVRYQAFDQLSRRHTGRLFEVHLPQELAGVKASAVRLRGTDIWKKEANFGTFTIGPMTTTAPYTRRLVAVFQDFGHLSLSYFPAPPKYSLVSPVTGLLVYDADSNTTSSAGSSRKIDFFVQGPPVNIRFNRFTSAKAEIKCARFGLAGKVELFRRTSEFVCSTRSAGYFAMVMEGSPEDLRNQRRSSMIVMIACGGGIVLILCLVGLVGIARYVKNKKLEEMESKAEEGEALDDFWIGKSKVPSATMTRTQPQLENL